MISKLKEFKVLGDERGKLIALEENKDIPFTMKRIFYIYGTKNDVPRGNHSHYKTKQFLVAVNGSCKVTLDNGKEQMNVWVKEGYVNYIGISDNVKEEISKVDCIVLPSFYREGTPRTLLESASMAKPIITTDNVGCRDVVDDGVSGYLCKMRDTNDLVLKLEKMLNLSDEKRIIMGKAGREKMINEFDEKIVINKYLDNIRFINN